MIDLANQIEAFFKRYGWDYQRDRDDLYRTGFKGQHAEYHVEIALNQEWVSFGIHPFVSRDNATEDPMAILQFILERNHHMSLAKFGMNDDGDIALTVELPIKGFCYSYFSDALGAISHYADEYGAFFHPAAHQIFS
jgi:hypothetical protein